MSNKKSETKVAQCPNPCIAQVSPTALDITVEPMGNCCEKIVQEVDPISIYMKQITTSIIKGKVNCGDSQTGVEGVIVVATGPNNQHFMGITNYNGEYSICVPSVNSNTSYSLEAYCCGSCSGDVCVDAPCDCGCKDTNPS